LTLHFKRRGFKRRGTSQSVNLDSSFPFHAYCMVEAALASDAITTIAKATKMAIPLLTNTISLNRSALRILSLDMWLSVDM
jgi:hypothetical protein